MKKILDLFPQIFTILYGILTIMAVMALIKEEENFLYWHSFYFVGGTLLIISALPNMSKWLLPSAYVLMIIVPIITGHIVGNFQLSHIIVRTIISEVIIFLFLKNN